AASLISASLREQIARSTPSPASSAAIAWPRPFEAPVTIAVFPVSPSSTPVRPSSARHAAKELAQPAGPFRALAVLDAAERQPNVLPSLPVGEERLAWHERHTLLAKRPLGQSRRVGTARERQPGEEATARPGPGHARW